MELDLEPLGALAVLRLAVGDTEGAAILFGQASLAWAVGVFLSPGRRSLYLICSILLWTMLVIILAERALAPLVWFPEGGAGLHEKSTLSFRSVFPLGMRSSKALSA